MKRVILVIFISVFILNHCIDSSDDVCGESFTEYESNDSFSNYNSFGITLKKGCTVTITGSMNDSDFNEYFNFNTGDTSNIKFTITWDKVAYDLDLRLVDESNTTIKQSFGTNDFEIMNWTPDFSYYPRFIIVDNASGITGQTTNYTLTIEGE